MNKKWIIASILIVVLLLLCGASLFAAWQGYRMAQTGGLSLRIQNNRVSAEAMEEKTLTVSGPVTLDVNNDFGEVSVSSGADGQVHIKAEKTGWGPNEAGAQKALEILEIKIEQNGNSIQVSAQLPEPDNVLTIGPIGTSVHFTITVPADTSVTFNSTNGDLALSGTTGAADLQTDFGGIQVSNVTGSVIAKTKNGNISATGITSDADVTLTSEFGSLTAQGIKATNVSAGSGNGTLDLRDIHASGAIKAGSDFGGISLINSQASILEIRSTNGKIAMDKVDVDGTVTVHNDFGDQTLNAVDASVYDLKTQSGKIKVDKARGTITAQSDFGDIEVLNVESGTIDLSSNNGAITFSGSLAQGPHSIDSDFGNITLTLPAEAALNVDLQTDFGKITSDFEIAVSGTLDNNHWTGKFNGGGTVLTVKTQNGNITINSN